VTGKAKTQLRPRRSRPRRGLTLADLIQRRAEVERRQSDANTLELVRQALDVDVDMIRAVVDQRLAEKGLI
jgi:hypothetical protein